MSSSPGTNDEELKRLCTNILRLSDGAQPDHNGLHAPFLKELKRHISIFPDDTNFYIESQPGAGFGIAVCLEDGCDKINIRLGPITDKSVSDKGLTAGIGALANFRSHVNNHQSHKTMRNVRVKKNNPSGSISFSKTPLSGSSPVKPAKRTHGGGESPATRFPSSTLSTPARSPVKSEQMDVDLSSLTRKRSLDIFSPKPTPVSSRQAEPSQVKDGNSEPSASAFGSSLVTKKPKLEPSTASTPTRSRAASLRSLSLSRPSDVKMTLQEKHSALRDWTRQLSVLEITRNSLKRKRKPSAHEVIRLRETVRKITEVEDKIKELNSQIPNESLDRISAISVKSEFDDGLSDFGGHNSSASSPDTSIEWPSFRESEDVKPSLSDLSRNERVYAPQSAITSSASAKAEEAVKSEEVLKSEAIKPEGVTPTSLPSVPSQTSPQPIASSSAMTLSRAPYSAPHENDTTDPRVVVDLMVPGAQGYMDVDSEDEYGDGGSDDEDFMNDIHSLQRRAAMLRGGSSQEDIRKYIASMAAEILPEDENMANRLKQLGLTAGNTFYKGMCISLLHHQVSGVGWMLDKENGRDKGGILADEMGLGKTVQTIACMLGNRSQDPAVKGTLILTPVALLRQWKHEIERVSNNQMSVIIYHGTQKSKSKKELQKYDAVLTTHQTVAFEWPDWNEEKLKEGNAKRNRSRRSDGFIVSDSEDEKPKKKPKKAKIGLLLQMDWHRVVIDEAQGIRNRATRVSRAVCELKSEYRWCLTGTPIINGLQDSYGLLRFLRIRPWYSWADFREYVMLFARKSPQLAANRLQGIFQTCLLRRRKDTKIDGRPLINLPPKDVQLVMLEFTPEERDIYKMVETRSQVIFNRYLRAGTVLKNYAHVLIMLLRLRQICSHTSLIAESEGQYVIKENEAYEDEDDAKRALSIEKQAFVNTLKTRLRDKALALIQAEKLKLEESQVEEEDCPICYDELSFGEAVYTNCMHLFCRACILQHINNTRDQEVTCPTCRGPIDRNRLYRRSAFEPTDEELGLKSNENGDDVKAKDEPMDVCLPGTSSKQPKKEDDDEEMPDVGDLLGTKKAKKREKKGKGKAIKKARPVRNCRNKRIVSDDDDEGGVDDLRVPEVEDDSDDNFIDSDVEDFIVPDDEDEEETNERLRKRRISKGKRPAVVSESDDSSSDEEEERRPRGRNARDLDGIDGPIKTLEVTVPSTKMKHMMNRLLELAESHPEEKTIVISQWTQCLEICAACLESKDIKYVKYTGAMRREQRDDAVHKFMYKEKKTVMLLSLKAGGVGLNLTRANRVINLDLGWSEAVEDQAFDRVHRLGQERAVFVERLVIRDTVENRVLTLQQQKKAVADGSLGEGTGKKIKRLNVRELANLFGLDVHGNVLE